MLRYPSPFARTLARRRDRLAKFANLLGDVPFRARTQIDTEMCTIAWLKMYELLVTYKLVAAEEAPSSSTSSSSSSFSSSSSVPTFSSVHLCEAPGAFICATNHYFQTRCCAAIASNSFNGSNNAHSHSSGSNSSSHSGGDFRWRAVSLNPYYEGNDMGAMIDDDRLILETRAHWMFGADNSGDIRRAHNIRAYWARAREDGCAPCALVTGDGAIDCNDNPGEQEAVTAQARLGADER